MSRVRKISLAVLNIKIHPHTPEMYVELMNDTFGKKQEVQIRGSDWGIPSYIKVMEEKNPLDGLYGKFYKFLQIDDNKPWLDLLKGITIEDDEGNPVPQVESHKKPNTKDIHFAFFPKKHRLIYDTKSLTPNMAKRFFDQQFSAPDIIAKYGIVDVIVESSMEAIEKILAMSEISSLEITITKPNPDDFDEIETEFKNRLERMNASQIKEEVKAKRGERLRPDDELKTLMKIARSNGRVYAEGWENDKKIVESTDPHPLLITETYNPDEETFIGAFISMTRRAFEQIRFL